ncbi:MAG: hypothetical protein ACP5I8_00705 [Phycisphaerae bacterium]
MSHKTYLRQVRQVRVKLLNALSTGTGPKAAFQLRQGVWGIEAHLPCDAAYTARQCRCANRQPGKLTHQPFGVVDADGQRLQKLILRRRRALGLVPSRWRMAWQRLGRIAAAFGGWIL